MQFVQDIKGKSAQLISGGAYAANFMTSTNTPCTNDFSTGIGLFYVITFILAAVLLFIWNLAVWFFIYASKSKVKPVDSALSKYETLDMATMTGSDESEGNPNLTENTQSTVNLAYEAEGQKEHFEFMQFLHNVSQARRPPLRSPRRSRSPPRSRFRA